MDDKKLKYELKLALLLKIIEENDLNYDKRYHLVLQAMALASKLEYKTGQKQEDNEWYILYIYLPDEKQISWHMPTNNIQWDGHTTKEKYDRCEEYKRNILNKFNKISY